MNLSTLTRRADELGRRALANPVRALLAAAAALVVIGVVAAAAGWLGLAVVAVLGVQTIVLVLLVDARRQAAASEADLRRRLDDSDRRVLGDVARARQAVLDAVADLRRDER